VDQLAGKITHEKKIGAKRKLNTGEKKIGVCHLAPSGIQTQEKKKSVCHLAPSGK
jgi:hypothetical protein